MASYHTSFTYKDGNGKYRNSFDENLIIVAFEPDEGFKDSFLSMDNVSDDYYDGTKKINYGSKYNTTAEVQIVVIKKDGTDMTVKEFRSYAQWLTGARVDSWLDMYVDDPAKNDPIYSFLGKFTNLEQYKYDARTIGLKLTFSSVSPWAFSNPHRFVCNIGQSLSITTKNNEVIAIKTNHTSNSDNNQSVDLAIDGRGILYPNGKDVHSSFSIEEFNVGTSSHEVVAYIDTSFHKIIDNESDDLYTYIYLDIDYVNYDSNDLYIENISLGEKTIVKGIDPGEVVSISGKQFIVSYRLDQITGDRVRNTNKIFGNNFNFVWPRLQPGLNYFSIYGSGAGVATFTYRHPMKIGDCTIDIDIYGNGINCGCSGNNNGGNNSSSGGTTTGCTIDGNALASMLGRVLR